MTDKIIQRGEQSLFYLRPWRWWSVAMMVLMLDVSSKAAISTLMAYGEAIPAVSYTHLTLPTIYSV